MRLRFPVTALLLLASAAGAQQPLSLQCYPRDAQVFALAPALGETSLGPARPELLVPEGTDRLVFRRSGWLEQTVPWPTTQPVQLAPDPAAPGARVLYHAAQWWWLGLLPLAAGAVSWSRRKPARQIPSIGPYRIVEKLGEGAMALVFRCVDPSGKPVAVKQMQPELRHDPVQRKRFTREIEISRQLTHRNLVAYAGSGDDYLALELVDGETLRQRLLREGPIPWTALRPLVQQACEGIAFAHELGISHRDLKPDNFLVTPDGRLVLLDFGVARGEQFTIATETGIVMGTPAYLAPEQLDGSTDPSVDQYALGVVLYELLTGRTPFQDPDPVALAFKHVQDPVPPLPSFVSPEVRDWIGKLLAKQPRNRFPSVRAALAALPM